MHGLNLPRHGIEKATKNRIRYSTERIQKLTVRLLEVVPSQGCRSKSQAVNPKGLNGAAS
jgi:hypothetical protein